MVILKLTARKSTGPHGVPRHQLAPRAGEETGESSNSHRFPRRTRKNLKEEIKDLKAELKNLEHDFYHSRLEFYEARASLEQANRNTVRAIEQRNDAWTREDVTRAELHGLQQYTAQIEQFNDMIYEEVHQLYDQLHPMVPPVVEDPEDELVEEPDEEQEPSMNEEIEPTENIYAEDEDEEVEPELILEEEDDDEDMIIIDDD